MERSESILDSQHSLSIASTVNLPLDKRLCVIGNLRHDDNICKATQFFNYPVITSETGFEILDDHSCCTIFVIESFDGDFYKKFQQHKRTHRLYGAVAFLQNYERKLSLSTSISRPIFNLAMQGAVICFTGFRNKEDLTILISLIHQMGGSIRKDMGSKVTHLISNACGGSKYQYAITFRVPVMSREWVFRCWEQRLNLNFTATNNDFVMIHKLKPFYGASVCFVGFSGEETEHMNDVLKLNGGQCVELGDSTCTHIVLENGCDLKLATSKKSQITSPVVVQKVVNANTSSESKALNESCLNQMNESILSEFNDTLNTTSKTPKRKYPFTDLSSVLNSSETPSKRGKYNSFLRKHSSKLIRNFRSSMGSFPIAATNSNCSSPFRTPKSCKKLSTAAAVPVTATKAPNLNETFLESEFSTDLDTRDSRLDLDPVVDESLIVEKPSGCAEAYVLKAEWFWASVQNEACADEKDYLFDDYIDTICSPSSCRSSTTPNSLGRRKRKRLNLSQLVRLDSSTYQSKRRSSINEAGLLSTSNSFLETTQNSDIVFLEPGSDISINKTLSRRQLTFLELVQTESNYVNILHTIMTMFKKHLEEMAENEALLNHTEIKMIFGNLPPIYDLHKQMLEDLREASKNWTEDISIGNLIKERSDDLLKAYPPFINYLETSKEVLVQCDQNKPRFHAFLKVCQTRPECGRQSLQDLLVRPVQRLPSISLLLSDILKHTSKSNADYAILEDALNSIKEIMTHINEDKRKTEGQVALFDIFNEISNCPPNLVSSHRSFVMKCEVNQLSERPSTRGNHLVLFLFSDHLEICKKKSKAFNTLKSPNATAHSSKGSIKLYKHIELIPLSAVKRVFDITDSDDCQRSFAFISLDRQYLRERLYSFMIIEENICKITFLRTLCRQIANNVCTTDSDKFLGNLESNQLEIDTKESNYGALSKAFKFATRTKIKVGRAFSFNKTPTTLRRTVSTVMSPMGSAQNVSPVNQLPEMKNLIVSSQ